MHASLISTLKLQKLTAAYLKPFPKGTNEAKIMPIS